MSKDQVNGKCTEDDYDELSEGLKKKAKSELNEDPDERQIKIRIIQDWLRHDNDMKILSEDIRFILKFMRNCKFDTEKTKQKITNRVQATKTIPRFFSGRDVDGQHFQRILNEKLYGFCPDHPDGEAIIFLKLNNYGPHDVDYTQARKFEFFGCESLMCLPKYQIHGGKFIVDVEACGLPLVKHITPTIIAEFIRSLVSVLPMRVKGVYVINLPVILKTIVNWLRLCCPMKLRSRIHFFGHEFEGLYNHIPKECVPFEYGGTGGTCDEMAERMKDIVYSQKENLLYYDRYIYT